MSTADTIERLRQTALQQPGARERASGMVKFACPQCVAEGHDKHHDNAGFFLRDGTWGCAYASGNPTLGREHWDAIGSVLGAFNGNGQHRPTAIVTEPEEPEPEPTPAPGPPYVITTPPDSFVTRYVTVAQQRTDAPAEAHELSSVLVLSALAGPRVRLPLAYRAEGVRLVLWGMNVVDSTSGRKTTVNEFACDVIRQTLGDEAILPWKGSPEAFRAGFCRPRRAGRRVRAR